MLWETLAGRHPFWRTSLIETARAIEAGAPALETMRPDLPRSLLTAVGRALDLDPGGRPSAAVLAGTLRLAGRKRRGRKGGDQTLAVPAVVPQLLPPLLAALVAGWAAWAIPFYPSGWAVGLGALAAVLTFLRPRIGVALALAVPILPLGNYALGAAVLDLVAALALFAVSWREPRSALFFAAGPLLAPIAALGLLPLASLAVRSPVRRGTQVAAAVLAAGLVAGVLAAALLLVPTVAAVPLVLAVWATCAAISVR